METIKIIRKPLDDQCFFFGIPITSLQKKYLEEILISKCVPNPKDYNIRVIGEFNQEVAMPETTMQEVKSSNIKAVGHDGNLKLSVQFKSGKGAIYDYFGVKKDVHAEMMAAPSIGKFFHSRIKGVYEFEKREAGNIPDHVEQDFTGGIGV